mmetsp:Transcript_48718/g.54500  ORF Transcript_48718/g.54500 Transcript_48718/m.54500 type:complete len:215 (+) Transcript_48718:80-724(+)
MSNSTGFTNIKSSEKTVREEIEVYLLTITVTAVLIAILGFIFQLTYNRNQVAREEREKKNEIERTQRNFDNTRAHNLMKDISNSMDNLYYQIMYKVIKERRNNKGYKGTLTAYYIDSKHDDELEEFYFAKKEWFGNWHYRVHASEIHFGPQLKDELLSVHYSFDMVCSKINQHATEETIVDICTIQKLRKEIYECNLIMMRQIQLMEEGYSRIQ